MLFRGHFNMNHKTWETESWWIRYYWLCKQCTSNIGGLWNLQSDVCRHGNMLHKQACVLVSILGYTRSVCGYVLCLQQCICLSLGSWQGYKCLHSSAHSINKHNICICKLMRLVRRSQREPQFPAWQGTSYKQKANIYLCRSLSGLRFVIG